MWANHCRVRGTRSKPVASALNTAAEAYGPGCRAAWAASATHLLLSRASRRTCAPHPHGDHNPGERQADTEFDGDVRRRPRAGGQRVEEVLDERVVARVQQHGGPLAAGPQPRPSREHAGGDDHRAEAGEPTL